MSADGFRADAVQQGDPSQSGGPSAWSVVREVGERDATVLVVASGEPGRKAVHHDHDGRDAACVHRREDGSHDRIGVRDDHPAHDAGPRPTKDDDGRGRSVHGREPRRGTDRQARSGSLQRRSRRNRQEGAWHSGEGRVLPGTPLHLVLLLADASGVH